jgi:hypothetical protein
VGLVPVVTLPPTRASTAKSVELAMAVLSRPANRLVSVAREANVIVSAVAVPYDGVVVVVVIVSSD